MNLLDATPPPDTPYKIARLYLKGASVEVPHMANLPSVAIAPEIGVDMQTEATPAWPGALECVLRISLHARLQGKDVFMVEVSEAAVFELDLSNVEDAHRFVRKIAPSVLFPFARKDLANLTVAAGFQPVLLDHVDFDSMLTKVMQAQRITRAPAPMRLDVIAAKPEAAAPALTSAPVAAAQASAQPEQAADSEWPDTTPLAEPGRCRQVTRPEIFTRAPVARLRSVSLRTMPRRSRSARRSTRCGIWTCTISPWPAPTARSR